MHSVVCTSHAFMVPPLHDASNYINIFQKLNHYYTYILS